MIKIFLEAGERFADVFGAAEVGDGVCDRTVIFQLQQGRQFFLIQFFDTGADIVGENEFKKGLLLCVELFFDGGPRSGGPLFSGQSRHGVGDIGKNVEEIAVRPR